ncbi:phosphoadenosine phosphosulfate reductase domain-containing protein [Nesterenkonia suensis]
MPLIRTSRMRPGDEEAWDKLERYDAALARRLPLDQMAERARQVIVDFAAQGPCYASTSWGKDSTVLAHLVATMPVSIPLVWVRVQDIENPDCLLVRDAFLDAHPQIDYHEIEVEASAARWWDHQAQDESSTRRTSRGGFDIAEQRFGGRHISGVRAEESRVRQIAMGRWGEAGPHAARPIGRWQATDIFAYLHHYDLPVHPAYSYSMAGRHDRRWLRVSSLGGIRGADRGRAEWEQTYYSEVIDHARQS